MGSSFQEGLNRVKKGDKWVLIGKEGKLVTAFELDETGQEFNLTITLSGSLIPAKRLGMWGYINKAGKEIIPFRYDFASKFQKGYAVVRQDSLYGMINEKGEPAVPPVYKNICNWSDSPYPAHSQGRWGAINSSGEVMIPFAYDFIEGFSEGLSFACKDGKCGFINHADQTVIPFYFAKKGLQPIKFRGGLAHVKAGGEWSYIDQPGKVYQQKE